MTDPYAVADSDRSDRWPQRIAALARIVGHLVPAGSLDPDAWPQTLTLAMPSQFKLTNLPAIFFGLGIACVGVLGVFAVVVGSTLLVLTALAHQAVRGRRPAPQAEDGAR